MQFGGYKNQIIRCTGCGNIVWQPKGKGNGGGRTNSKSKSDPDIIDVDFEERWRSPISLCLLCKTSSSYSILYLQHLVRFYALCKFFFRNHTTKLIIKPTLICLFWSRIISSRCLLDLLYAHRIEPLLPYSYISLQFLFFLDLSCVQFSGFLSFSQILGFIPEIMWILLQ